MFSGKKKKGSCIPSEKKKSEFDRSSIESKSVATTPNYHMAWPEILLFSFFLLSSSEIYDGGLFPVSPVNLINNVGNAKSSPKLFVCLYFPWCYAIKGERKFKRSI